MEKNLLSISTPHCKDQVDKWYHIQLGSISKYLYLEKKIIVSRHNVKWFFFKVIFYG